MLESFSGQAQGPHWIQPHPGIPPNVPKHQAQLLKYGLPWMHPKRVPCGTVEEVHLLHGANAVVHISTVELGHYPFVHS